MFSLTNKQKAIELQSLLSNEHVCSYSTNAQKMSIDNRVTIRKWALPVSGARSNSHVRNWMLLQRAAGLGRLSSAGTTKILQ